tara:strand:+ start:157 stop:867 length:711 start_codon:yes stop_codon:yes gene_type:complete
LKEFKKECLINKILNNENLINILSKPFYLFLVINLILISGCRVLNKKEEISICPSTRLPCLASTEYVLLITNKGEIKLELYGELAPVTVGNFVDFVEKGAYDNTNFNRVIKKPYPFIIRGGDTSFIKGENKFIDSKTGKIRYIPLEIKLKTNKLPTYGKVIDVSNQKNNIELKHKRFYLSMARSRAVNSASSQFYILLKSLPELDGRYAVFGRVISGMKVLDLIQEEDFIVEAQKL